MADNTINTQSAASHAGADIRPYLSGLFVWGTWLVLLAAALWLVATCGRNVPFADDWEILPALTGDQPVTLQWLWSQHNEHRIPLPRLVVLGLLGVSGNDFRAGMYFNVMLLAGLAAATIVVAKQLRGVTTWSDAFFPLLFLNWGHCENLLWCWQVEFLSSTLLAGIVLLLIASSREGMTLGRILGITCCLILLPLTGANGFVLTPPLLLWLPYAALTWWRNRATSPKRESLLVLVALAAAFIPATTYLLTFQRSANHLPTPNVQAAVQTALECLSMSLGPVGEVWRIAAFATLGLGFFAGWLLVGVCGQQPGERCRALGLLFFLIGSLGLCVAIGWGRGGLGRGAGLTGRYFTLLAPAVACVYLVLIVYGDRAWQWWAQSGLFCLVLLSTLHNIPVILNYSSFRREVAESFQQDVAEGHPPSILASRYSSVPHTLYPDRDKLQQFLAMAGRANLNQFRGMQSDPDYKLVPLGQIQTEVQSGGIILLKKPQLVYGISLNLSLAKSASGYVDLTLHWQTQDRQGGPATQRSKSLVVLAQPGELTLLFWINEVVSQFRVDVGDLASHMNSRRLSLLLPESSGSNSSLREKGITPEQERKPAPNP